MAQYLDYEGLSLYDSLIKALVESGDANALAEIAKRVEKEISGSNGKAQIFNERDGGGAKFVNNDGTESFVGVNDGGETGLAAQIYADKFVEGKWQGAKIDVTNGGIYYTVGDKSFRDRAVEDNEIAVKGDVKSLVDNAVSQLVDNAPEALDTLREIAEWIAGADSDVEKLALDIVNNAAAIAENRVNIESAVDAASDAYNSAAKRIKDLEDIIGVGGSDGEDVNLIDKVANIEDRLDAIREEEDESIPEDKINGLFA